ncbi:MAG: NUDIX hydrolase [Holdemanella porci]
MNFCAGGIEGSEHESALLAAKRELQEETGYVSRSLETYIYHSQQSYHSG